MAAVRPARPPTYETYSVFFHLWGLLHQKNKALQIAGLYFNITPK